MNKSNPKHSEFPAPSEKPVILFLIGGACVLALILLCVGKTHAADLTVSYTVPTTCEDGSPLTACPTTGFELSKGTALNSAYAVLETLAPTVTSKRYTNLTPGTYCYYVKTVSNALKSADSNRACADVPFLPPKAPQGITVTIQVSIAGPP